MKKGIVQEACETVFREYSKKTYDELVTLIGNPDCFSRNKKGDEYFFEIEAKEINDTTVSVCVMCKKKSSLSASRAIYFGKNVSGDITINDDNLVF